MSISSGINVVSRENDRFWIFNDSVIAESSSRKSRPIGAIQDAIIAINSANKNFNQFSFDSKKLYCGFTPRFNNSYEDRKEALQLIASYLPNAKVYLNELVIFYNEIQIFCRQFVEHKQNEMQRQLDEHRKAKLGTSLSFHKSINSGIESELTLVDIVNDWFLVHPMAKNHDKELLFTDTIRFSTFPNLKRAIHVGYEHRKADVLFECQDPLGIKSLYAVSLKNRDSGEWTSNCPKCEEIDAFLKNVFNDELIETRQHYNKRGHAVFNHYDAKFINGISDVTAKISRELASQAVFGTDNDKCDAVIVHSFTNGYQNDRCIVQEKDNTNTCVGVFTVNRLATSIDDLMNTDYEPCLLLRKKTNTSFTYNGAVYHNLGLAIAFRSRVVSSKTGELKSNTREYDMFTEDEEAA